MNETIEQKESVSLIQALDQATKTDLKTIDDRISELSNELESLRAIRKVLNIKLNGKSPRQPSTRKESSDGTELAKEIYDLLSREGSLPDSVISSRLGRDPRGVAGCMSKSDWFTKTPEGDMDIARN